MPPKVHGVMPIQELRKAAAGGMIVSPHSPIPRENLQPASLDLRLGNMAHRLRCSFLPHNGSVEGRLEDLAMESLPLDRGAVLEINRPYLAPLMEELDLPPDTRARANPRSSTGRMDLFTRIITDGSAQFDNVAPGYRGRMYLEIVSRSFACRIRTGISLNQVRFLRGDPRISGDDLLERHLREPLALLEGGPCLFGPGELDGGVPLSVDLAGGGNENGTVGYRARRNSGLLDLTEAGGNQAGDFWEPVQAEARPEARARARGALSPGLPGGDADTAGPGGGDGGAGPPERGVPDPLRGVLRPGVRVRRRGGQGGDGDPGPRRAIHAGARPAGVPAGVRGDVGGAGGTLRGRRRVVLPGAGTPAQQVLPAVTEPGHDGRSKIRRIERQEQEAVHASATCNVFSSSFTPPPHPANRIRVIPVTNHPIRVTA